MGQAMSALSDAKEVFAAAGSGKSCPLGRRLSLRLNELAKQTAGPVGGQFSQLWLRGSGTGHETVIRASNLQASITLPRVGPACTDSAAGVR